MKKRSIAVVPLVILFSLFFFSITVFSFSNLSRPASVRRESGQHTAPGPAEAPAVMQYGHQPAGVGGGEWNIVFDDLPTEQRVAIERAIETNVTRLQTENRLPALSLQNAVTLSWPVVAAPHLDDQGYHGIANFVDHNTFYPNALRDYACGSRTYDTVSGYNHPGTDIFSWPFPWSRMDNDEILVVTAAPGVIVFKQDGNYDRNCSFTSSPWNAVYVRHADGTIASYGHLKNGSITAKNVGDTVARGEYLGVMGSSGSSTAPHLHLELETIANVTLDPYAGICNGSTGVTLWGGQTPYYDTAVNKMTTGHQPPVITECATPEQPHEATEFEPGDTIYFTTYYRDQRGNTPSGYAIYRPDGSVYEAWSHAIAADHYAASWWWWSFDLAPDEQQGVWEFHASIAGEIYDHTFLVGTAPEEEPPPPPTTITVTQPNGGEIITPGGTISISWQTILTSGLAISLYQAEALSRTLTTTVTLSGTGQLTWTTPISLETSGHYRIRATSLVDASDFDESDGNFVIGILDLDRFLPFVGKPDP